MSWNGRAARVRERASVKDWRAAKGERLAPRNTIAAGDVDMNNEDDYIYHYTKTTRTTSP